MTSKFSIDNRDLLQRISSGEAVVGIVFGNLIVRELAAFRLAAMDSEPVAYMTYKGYLLHAGDPKLAEYSEPMPLYADPRPEPISAEPVAWLPSGGGAKNVVVFDSGNAYADPLREVTPLYRHAQPAPVVPEEWTIADAVKFCKETGRQDAGAAMDAWNACRAAMLNGGKP